MRDPAHYRELARKCRMLGNAGSCPEDRARLRSLADEYEQRAQRLEAEAKNEPPLKAK